MIESNEKKHLGLISLGILIPLVVYVLLPFLGIDILESTFALDNIFKVLLLFIGIGVYFYSCYLGVSKFVIMPVLALFFYQIFNRILIYYSPVVINLRTLVILFIAPIGLFFLKKYAFKKNFAPFIFLIGFYLLNLGYTVFNYAYSPNFIYNLNFYIYKKSTVIPILYSVDLAIILTFILAAVYFTLNIFKSENKLATKQFNIILASFIIINSIVCLLGFITGDAHLTNVSAGIQRINGLFTHSNIFAFFNACSAIYLSSVLPKVSDKKFKYLFITALLFAVISTLLSFSRINSFAVLSILAINYLVFSKEKFKASINLVQVTIASILLFFAVDFKLGWNLSEMIFSRINDIQSSEFRPMVLKYLSSQIHIDGTLIYGKGIASCSNTLFRLFSDRFYINTPIVYHPHNSFINVFYDYGLIGFLLYYSTFIALLKTGIKKLYLDSQINPSALILTEIIIFSLIASLVDCYTFNMEMLPIWILISITYVNTLEFSKQQPNT